MLRRNFLTSAAMLLTTPLCGLATRTTQQDTGSTELFSDDSRKQEIVDARSHFETIHINQDVSGVRFRLLNGDYLQASVFPQDHLDHVTIERDCRSILECFLKHNGPKHRCDLHHWLQHHAVGVVVFSGHASGNHQVSMVINGHLSGDGFAVRQQYRPICRRCGNSIASYWADARVHCISCGELYSSATIVGAYRLNTI